MKKLIESDELKQIQLDILDDVAKFCDNNNLSYFLTYGTLLGAIRHNGFIPWDDDIDIAMPRPDYERFICNYHSKNDLYKVISHSNNTDYGLPHAKVYHSGTTLNEIMYKQVPYGVYIDVFPIDGFKDIDQVRQAQRYRRLLNAKNARLLSKRKFVKIILILLTKILYTGMSVNKILDKIDSICLLGKYEDCSKVGFIPTLNSGLKDVYDKDLVIETTIHDFENHKFRIPIGYDRYLKQVYGNYMQYPPEEERVSNHSFEAWWK